jgi:hypothetical protein
LAIHLRQSFAFSAKSRQKQKRLRPLQLDVNRAIHFTHPARAERRKDFVSA